MPKFKEITGERFGRLVALNFSRVRGNNYIWSFQCDCGKKKEIWKVAVMSGHTKSCGCLQIEKNIKRSTKHGHARRGKISKTYQVWNNMMNRCRTHPDYAGRGIKVCNDWVSYEGFFKDMGESPEGKTIERINNDGDYCKENCRWATRAEQSENTRATRLITYKNKTQSVSKWAREKGIDRKVIIYRINRGWKMRDVMEVSPFCGNRYV